MGIDALRSIDPDCNLFNDIYCSIDNSNVSRYYSVQQYNQAIDEHAPNISIFNYNVRSLRSNSDGLLAFLQSFHKLPDVIVLTETLLNPDESDSTYLDSHQMFHTIRGHDRSWVSVLVSKDIRVLRLDHLSVCIQTIELCVLSLSCNETEIIIFGTYRPHSDIIGSFCDVVQNMLQDRNISGKTVIFAGDMNINLLLQENAQVGEFTALMQSLSFLPVITRPIRFDPRRCTDPSLLDHIWANNVNHFLSGILHYDVTDHCPTFYSTGHYQRL